jgi:hypothetical protein
MLVGANLAIVTDAMKFRSAACGAGASLATRCKPHEGEAACRLSDIGHPSAAFERN